MRQRNAGVTPGRRQAELDAAVASIGSRAIGIQGDVSKQGDLDRIFSVIQAKAALFLTSDDSSFINGIELFVDGGAAQI